MSSNNKENEEVDLGSLFVILGRGFSKLFNFIGAIFKNLFHFLIQILFFIKSNIIKLGVATFVGVLAGIFSESKLGNRYEGSLYVESNFNSSRQLYSNIQFYNDLVKQKETTLLTRIFDISEQEAKSLMSFRIYPVVNENNILTSYDKLVQSVDSSTVKSYSYEKFKSSFTKFDYKMHQILVISTKENIFFKLSKPIITSIINNDYFKNLKKINKQNLLRTDSLLRRSLKKADSLHYIYKKVLLEEAKKPNSGTTIDLGRGNQTSNKELELFAKDIELNENLIEVNEDLSEKSQIINIVSNFQPIGYKIRDIERNKIFQFGLAGFGLMVLFLLSLNLNMFLGTYRKAKQ